MALGGILQGAGAVLGGLGGLGGADQQQLQRDQNLFNTQQQLRNFQFQAEQGDIGRQFQAALFNAQAGGQGDVNEGLLALMQQLQGNVGAGILSPEQQERQVGLQTQALQPTQNRLASTLAREFGLQNPAAQLALGREVVAGEQRIRAGIAEQQSQRQFQAQQQLNQLLALLQGRVGSERTVEAPANNTPEGLAGLQEFIAQRQNRRNQGPF